MTSGELYQTGEFSRVDPRTLWVASRARNAVRRPFLIGIVGALTFVVMLVSLVVVPHERARGAARAAAARRLTRVDTVPLAARAEHAGRASAAADSALGAARRRFAASAAPAEALPLALVAYRDSLVATVVTLNRLIARAETAPLPASYRALAEGSGLSAVPRVRVLLDSLGQVERERQAFGGVGGVDPIFVALAARAAAIGKSIQDVAEARRADLRRQIVALRPPPPEHSVASLAADTLARAAAADSARRLMIVAAHDLRAARTTNNEIDRQTERARQRANIVAPPLAMLAAALFLGAVFGFAASLGAEMHRPRVSDAREAERLTRTRVLAHIRPRPPTPERARRRADQLAPPLLDTNSDSYRLLYLHLAPTGSTLPLVTVTGADAAIIAAVGTNLAAAAAYEARSTLLVDGDLLSCAVAGVLRIHPEPGLAAVVSGERDWAEVIVTTTIGRDRAMDVVPAGWWWGDAMDAGVAEGVRRDLARTARRYDFTVLVAPAAQALEPATSILPSPDVVLCAHVSHTPLRVLAATIDDLRRAGTRVRGLVLWDAEAPQIASRAVIAETTHRLVPLAEETERGPVESGV